MEAKVTTTPAFNFSLDLSAVSKIEQALAFFRNSHPAAKDPDLDQITQLFKTTIEKVREYDAAIRGIQITSSSAGLQPEVDDAVPTASETPPQLEKRAAPGAPVAPPSDLPLGNLPPGGFPAAPTHGGDIHILEDLTKAILPSESGAKVPPSNVSDLTVDDAIIGLTPPESDSPRIGGPPSASSPFPPGKVADSDVPDGAPPKPPVDEEY